MSSQNPCSDRVFCFFLISFYIILRHCSFRLFHKFNYKMHLLLVTFKLKSPFAVVEDRQWRIFCGASEAVASPHPSFENTAYTFILLYIFIMITMKLLRKVGNLRTNSSEDFFFRDYDDFGKKIGKYEIKDLFFLENTNFCESLPWVPNFDYPSLRTRLKINFSDDCNFKK